MQKLIEQRHRNLPQEAGYLYQTKQNEKAGAGDRDNRSGIEHHYGTCAGQWKDAHQVSCG
jgi:hypothetical protein